MDGAVHAHGESMHGSVSARSEDIRVGMHRDRRFRDTHVRSRDAPAYPSRFECRSHTAGNSGSFATDCITGPAYDEPGRPNFEGGDAAAGIHATPRRARIHAREFGMISSLDFSKHLELVAMSDGRP